MQRVVVSSMWLSMGTKQPTELEKSQQLTGKKTSILVPHRGNIIVVDVTHRIRALAGASYSKMAMFTCKQMVDVTIINKQTSEYKMYKQILRNVTHQKTAHNIRMCSPSFAQVRT